MKTWYSVESVDVFAYGVAFHSYFCCFRKFLCHRLSDCVTVISTAVPPTTEIVTHHDDAMQLQKESLFVVFQKRNRI